MEMIPRKLIEDTLMEITQNSIDEILSDQQRFLKNQPHIAEFIIQFTEGQNQELTELALHLAHVVWRTFCAVNGGSLLTASLEDIVRSIEDKQEWVEAFHKLYDESSYNFAYQLIDREPSFTQPQVMEYLLDILLEEGQVNPCLGSQEQGFLFWLLLIVVDVFDQMDITVYGPVH